MEVVLKPYLLAQISIMRQVGKASKWTVYGLTSLPNAVNIHTHLWGALLFAYFILCVLVDGIHPDATWRDTAVCSIFLVSAVFCMTGSATYHTSLCHSKAVRLAFYSLQQSLHVLLCRSPTNVTV